ncbi:hypothetical protein [Undibacterium crateris]|uniref:hypothetical protein n=1 Tax=Undibacterium crateris TaxID=2528175 RepID=UPI0013895330|nr:hypothetical protein [Undibacterium crateris]NDI85613.1 hypothetical protein [Undibacterium crateris]
MKLIKIAILIAASSVATFFYFHHEQSAATNQDTHPVKQNLAPQISVKKNEATVPNKLSVSEKDKSLSMLLSESKNMRAFVEYAKKFPEKGGYGYGLRALYDCAYARGLLTKKQSNLQYDPRKNSESYAARQTSFEAVRYRCQDFSDSELASAAIEAHKAEGVQKGDFILQAEKLRSTISTNKPVESAKVKEKILDQIFLTKDPLLVAEYGFKVANDGKAQGSSFVLDGKSYPTFSVDGWMIRTAWKLAACELQADCSANNMEVVSSCLGYARCFPDLPSYLKFELAGYGDSDGSKYVQAQLLSRQILDAINRGDLQFFRPKK